MEDLGNRIQSLRKSKSMSQEDLANQLGVSRQAISKWERGEALPDLYNARSIAVVFEISIDELMGNVTQQNNTKLIDRNRVAISLMVVPTILMGLIGIISLVALVLGGLRL